MTYKCKWKYINTKIPIGRSHKPNILAITVSNSMVNMISKVCVTETLVPNPLNYSDNVFSASSIETFSTVN